MAKNIHHQTYLIQQLLDQTRADRLFDLYNAILLQYYEDTGSAPQVFFKNLLPLINDSLKSSLNKLVRSPRVAIVIPTRTRMIDQLLLGFVESLRDEEGVDFTPFIYSADGNIPFLYSDILPNLLIQKYNLIYTVGIECTKAVADFFKSHSQTIPILFTSVHSPEKLNLDPRYVTGLSSNYESNTYVSTLLAVKPQMKRVGIIYNPEEGRGASQTFKEETVSLLQDRGINTFIARVKTAQDITSQVQPFISQIDTLMLLQSNVSADPMKKLTEMCNETSITLCSGYLYGILDGAALSFGYPEYITGKMAAQKAGAILRDGTPINKIVIHPPYTKYQILINSKTQDKQGLGLDLNTRLFTQRGIIHPQ